MGFPVHDSIIVEKEHYDYLYKIMMEEYKEVMDFEPMVATGYRHSYPSAWYRPLIFLPGAGAYFSEL